MKKKWMRSVMIPLLLFAVMLSSACGSTKVEAGAAVHSPESQEQAAEESDPLIAPLAKAPAKQYVVTAYKSEESEVFIWECLHKYAPSDAIAAGIMGMFWRESFFRSDATAHWATVLKTTGYDQARDFTAKIDAGLADGSTKEMFIQEVNGIIGGYGLSMWYSTTRLSGLYDFAREWGTSISDAEMQCAYAVESMKSYTELWEELQTITDPALAGARIGLLYDGSSSGYGAIGSMAKNFYDKYAVTDGE